MADVFLRSVPSDANPDDPRLYENAADAGGAITGTGDLTAPAQALAATGLETFAATGTVDASAGTSAGVALETFSASGALAALAGAAAGTGIQQVTGTAAITAPTADMAGAGVETLAGSAAVAAEASTLAAAGEQTVAGTGAIEAPVGAGASGGAISVTGTAAVTAPAGEVVGVAQVVADVVEVVPPHPVSFSTDDWLFWPINRPVAIAGTGGVVAAPTRARGAGRVSPPEVMDEALLGLIAEYDDLALLSL